MGRLHDGEGLTRRTFLAGSAALAASALTGCASDSAEHRRPRPTSIQHPPKAAGGHRRRVAGERWDPSLPEGADLIPQIEHVVVVMMENHSFDNYFGMLGRGDGFRLDPAGRPLDACAAADGKVLRAFHMPNTCQLPRVPSQAWNATHVQWDEGRMDGFVRSESGPVSMGYWTGADLPFYYGLARTFPLCDRWFASCMAQTYPNRRFLLAATAQGDIRTSNETLTDPPPPNGTIMDALNRHSIPWRNYYTDLPTTGLYLPVLQTNGDKVVKVDRFFNDAATGRLPAFALLDPNFDHGSEENSEDITRGEAFSARVIEAVLRGPAWMKTLLVWCYDEHGGYYDHVPPPAAPAPDDVPPRLAPGDVPGGYNRLGFRVPAVVVSPFAKDDYVSSVVHDHTSVLALLQHKFNLPALTARDGWADDLLDCLELDRHPRFAVPPTLPQPANRAPFGSDGTPPPQCTTGGPVPTV
jgi:phospholipase C